MIRAFRDAWVIPELRSRLLFTLVVLAFYRLGSYIPTPGVDFNKIKEKSASKSDKEESQEKKKIRVKH
jgi:preprotein translocase subunit SecY